MNGVMNQCYSERDAALVQVGNLLALSGQLAGEYRQLVDAYRELAGHMPSGSYLSVSVGSFPGSIAALQRPGNKHTRGDVESSAETVWLRACGIIKTIRRGYLGESSPLSPQQRQRLVEDVESVNLLLSGQPVPRQLALSLYP